MPLVPQCVKAPNSEEITHLLPGEGDMDKRLFFILRPHQLITYDKTSREHSFTECWSETQEGGNNRHSESPKQLIKEIGTFIDVNVDDIHLAAAHQLPDTKNVKHQLIVKFVHRDKREEMYKNRRNLIGKNINNLSSVQAAMGLAATSNNKIHINESLTGLSRYF